MHYRIFALAKWAGVDLHLSFHPSISSLTIIVAIASTITVQAAATKCTQTYMNISVNDSMFNSLP
jgi:hypothetical protein